MKKGKFIVLYGVNNLGKTTQAKLLVQKLNSTGQGRAKYLKYPIYDLAPSGQILNEYLRKGNPYRFTPREAQMLYAFNRCQYEPVLKADLEEGINVVAEDYWGTGAAWGMGAGVETDFMLKLNGNFLKEDLAILFVGQRFASGIEAKHLHETDTGLTRKVEVAHNELAKQFSWKIVDSNQSIEKVSEDIWKLCANI